MKKLLIVVIIIALAGGAYVAFGPKKKEEPQIKYITAVVEQGTLKAEINASGTLRPMVEVLVGSQVSGTIKELYADFESDVKKGQVIALIDPDTYKAKRQQAYADLVAAKAALAKAVVAREDEARTLRRKTALIEKGSISESEFDTAKAKADESVAQVEVERARVSQMEAKLNEAELQLRYTRIEAPVDGVVIGRSMDVGQTVTASFQTPLLFKIAEDLTRMQVHTNVDEADIGRVRVGQKSTFSVAAFPEESFNAVVTQIRNDPKIEQNVVTYNVVLDVDNPDLKLRPGMTADVRILLQEVKEALSVPDQAFRFEPKGSKAVGPAPSGPAEKRVWKLEPGNDIRPLTVKVGVVGNERTQVFSKELKAGDKVVMEAIQSEKAGGRGPALRFRF